MRTIDAAMQSALDAETRRPAIALTIEDHTIHLTPYQSPGLVDQWSDVCLANDGSIVRVNLTRSTFGQTANFQHARITDPAQASQWSTVTTFSGGSGNMLDDGGCAVSNNAGTLRAFATSTAGSPYKLLVWSSTDNGLTWTGPVTIVLPGNVATYGLGSAGNNDLFLIYDVTGSPRDLGVCLFSGGSWGSVHNWGQGHLTIGYGITASWTGSLYNVAYSDGRTLGSTTCNSSGSTWTAPLAIAPATSDAVGRVSPRLSLYDGRYHLVCNEIDGGAISGSVYSYCRVRESIDFIHWSDGWLLHEITCQYGGNLFSLTSPQSGSSGARYYFSQPTTVLSTPAYSSGNANQYLDVSASVLSYKRTEQINKSAELQIILDNKGGQYNNLINLTGGSNFQPITPNAILKLGEGYLVGNPPLTRDTIPTGTYRLTRVSIERSPDQNQIKLLGRDLSYQLDRIARWQNTFSGQTLQYMLLEVCARASIFSPTISGGSQLSQTIPTFVIQAGLTYRKALESLCTTYGLDYFLDQNETLQIREVLATDSPIWTYQPEVELLSFGANYERANHIIASGKPPGTTSFSLTTSEAYDDTANVATRVERVLHHVDLKLTTVAQCQSAANLIMYSEQRGQVAHVIVVPLNPALQLLDVVTLTDSVAPGGSGQSSTVRILGHTASYDAQTAEYESLLSLQGR